MKNIECFFSIIVYLILANITKSIVFDKPVYIGQYSLRTNDIVLPQVSIQTSLKDDAYTVTLDGGKHLIFWLYICILEGQFILSKIYRQNIM